MTYNGVKKIRSKGTYVKFDLNSDAPKSVYEKDSISGVKKNLTSENVKHATTKIINVDMMSRKQLKQKLKEIIRKNKAK